MAQKLMGKKLYVFWTAKAIKGINALANIRFCLRPAIITIERD